MNKIINMSMTVNLDIGYLSFFPEEACVWKDKQGSYKAYAGSIICAIYDSLDGANPYTIVNLVNDIVSNNYNEEELLDILPAVILDQNGDEVNTDYSTLRDIDDTYIREGVVKGIHKAIIDYMI